MSTTGSSRWTRRAITAAPIVLVLVVAGVALLGLRNDDELPAPVDIAASGPRFETLAELVEAADVIVEGRIVGVSDGRSITDPSDPTTGFTTSLFQLEVTTAYVGTTATSLIVEQEAALLDGTPIVVNGLRPNAVGDAGFWFLVRGGDEEFPYVALVNEQGRLLVEDGSSLVDVLGRPTEVERLRTLLIP